MKTILEARNISKQFGGVKAANQVNMKVEEKEIFGIIGPNGAGKTTFFNVISGLFKPTSGEVWFRGENITGKHPEQIARLGMSRTFQNVQLFKHMTVVDNIKIGFHIHTKTMMFDAMLHTKRYKADEAFIHENSLKLLEQLDLISCSNMLAGNLAYGTQRKVEIARALAIEPKILLLDEPAAGMNISETASLLEFIQELNAIGYTIAVIEHDMKFIMNLCNRIMVLDHGTKIAEGTPFEVRENQDVCKAYFGNRAIC